MSAQLSKHHFLPAAIIACCLAFGALNGCSSPRRDEIEVGSSGVNLPVSNPANAVLHSQTSPFLATGTVTPIIRAIPKSGTVITTASHSGTPGPEAFYTPTPFPPGITPPTPRPILRGEMPPMTPWDQFIPRPPTSHPGVEPNFLTPRPTNTLVPMMLTGIARFTQEATTPMPPVGTPVISTPSP